MGNAVMMRYSVQCSQASQDLSLWRGVVLRRLSIAFLSFLIRVSQTMPFFTHHLTKNSTTLHEKGQVDLYSREVILTTGLDLLYLYRGDPKPR